MLKYSVAFFSALVLVGVALPNALADAKGKKVAHLTTAIQLPYISTLAKSLTEAGASYGMDVTVFSSPFDPAIQSQQMDDAVARRFDMIILTAVSEQAIVPALTRANQAGIPVIALIDPPKPGTEKLYTSFVGDDQPELGRIAARSMLKAIKASGRDGGRMPEICQWCFTVPSFSIHRIQESHETLLHILWDLIHVIRGEEDVI